MHVLPRILLLAFALLLAPAIASGQQPIGSSGTPLGDIARQQRKQSGKKVAKVITNEDLAASTDSVADTAGAVSSARSETEASKSADSSKSGTKAEGGDSKDSSVEDVKKHDEQFRTQYVEQKKQLAFLERELSVLQREAQIQVAEYYADAGAQLRDPKAWAEKRKKQEDDIAAKQKQVDEAKSKLEDLKEQGRKAGASPRAFDDEVTKEPTQ